MRVEDTNMSVEDTNLHAEDTNPRVSDTNLCVEDTSRYITRVECVWNILIREYQVLIFVWKKLLYSYVWNTLIFVGRY